MTFHRNFAYFDLEVCFAKLSLYACANTPVGDAGTWERDWETRGKVHADNIVINFFCNYVTGNTVFNLQFRTTLNGMNFKFVPHALWVEKQNILLQHMRKEEFYILTNKCGSKPEHENEAEGT